MLASSYWYKLQKSFGYGFDAWCVFLVSVSKALLRTVKRKNDESSAFRSGFRFLNVAKMLKSKVYDSKVIAWVMAEAR